MDLPFTCCGCGVVYDVTSWAALPLNGYMCSHADPTGPEEHLELRTCPTCRMTKAVDVGAGHAGAHNWTNAETKETNDD